MSLASGITARAAGSRLIRLAIAAISALVALGLGFLTHPDGLWLCYSGGVLASAWFGGFKPGLVTAVFLLAAGLFLAPEWESVLFAALALAICAATRALRMEQQRTVRAEDRLRQLLESTADAVLSVDSEFRIVYANSSAAKIGKKPAAQLFGRSLRTLFPETPAISVYRELNRALRDNTGVHFEQAFEHAPEDRKAWYDFRAYPAPGGLNIFIRDITASKTAENDEHSRLAALVHDVPVGIIVASVDGVVQSANKAVCDLFGSQVRPGDHIPESGKGTLRSFSGQVLEPGEWPLAKTLASGQAVSRREVEYIRPDGAVVAMVASAVPLLDSDGSMRCALATYSDVNSLREMHHSLRTSEARLRRLFESPIVGVFSGCDDRIIEANDAFLELLGYTREEVAAGKLRWPEITPPEFVNSDLDAIRQLTRNGFSKPFQKEFSTRDGRRVPVVIGIAAYEPGAWSPWICYVLDMSEHRRLEERLRHTARLESVGLLAGGVAHDFNNILTGIMGNASLALETIASGDATNRRDASEFIENVLRASERASHLTRQLLAYAGKGRVFVHSIDVSQLVRDIGQLVRTSIPRNVQLEFDLTDGLPPVDADGSQIEQLLMNLVINGAEAICDKPGTVRVSTALRDIEEPWGRTDEIDTELPAGKYVSITVHDTGCGMDEATRKRMFDPFFTTKFTGRGLGLAAATGIVRTHKGAIRVESTAGMGSTFEVLLPVSMEPVSSSPVDDTLITPEIHRSGTILVVDDEEVVRAVAKTTLERYGYTVLLASNGREALDIFRGLCHSICMVILDMTMPVMGGEETLHQMVSIQSGVRILLTSGYDHQDLARRFETSDYAGFIQKPFTATALAERVRATLAP